MLRTLELRGLMLHLSLFLHCFLQQIEDDEDQSSGLRALLDSVKHLFDNLVVATRVIVTTRRLGTIVAPRGTNRMKSNSILATSAAAASKLKKQKDYFAGDEDNDDDDDDDEIDTVEQKRKTSNHKSALKVILDKEDDDDDEDEENDDDADQEEDERFVEQGGVETYRILEVNFAKNLIKNVELNCLI